MQMTFRQILDESLKTYQLDQFDHNSIAPRAMSDLELQVFKDVTAKYGYSYRRQDMKEKYMMFWRERLD